MCKVDKVCIRVSLPTIGLQDFAPLSLRNTSGLYARSF